MSQDPSAPEPSTEHLPPRASVRTFEPSGNERISDGRSGDLLGALGRMKTTVDVVGKLIPAGLATIYALGYAVTARRLAEYGLATTQLVNAQYLVAGFPPFLLLAATVGVVWSSLRYTPRANRRSPFVPLGIMILVAFIGLVIGEIGGLVPFEEANPATYFFALLRLLLGEAALWFLVAGVRSGFFAAAARSPRSPNPDGFDQWRMPLYLAVLAGTFILFAFIRAANIHTLIPQAYGGTKPIVIRLYAPRLSLPQDLTSKGTSSDSGVLARTEPLELLFQSDKVFVVRPVSDSSGRVWTLDSRVVTSVITGRP